MLDFLDFFGVVTYVMLGSIADDVASLSMCGVNLVLAFVYSSRPKSFTKISDRSKVICERCSFTKLLWQKFTLRRRQNKFLKWSKYNLGELEWKSLKIVKHKYIIKTFIQKFGM
jgi:hypothetical protein